VFSGFTNVGDGASTAQSIRFQPYMEQLYSAPRHQYVQSHRL